ncbi:IS1634 family transposase [Solitalea lacus]|uniref:IS1634 family transposase n=1 Tax=Solitalea lacus TaxID=2911172 RepID=UPI001EDBA7F7|nr:IS1634 family transposase [Solitalea lacus]UKJ07127.1 IS1634 family transposase [Solitalea lacus]UKJ07465.1 IS1634 family transposase [Solitalea lacus]
MAFLRVENKKSGKYLRIVESYRDESGISRHRILYTLGKLEDYTPEELKRIGSKLYELGGGDLKDLLEITTGEKARFNYGYFQVFSKALSHYKLPRLFGQIGSKHKLGFDLQNAVLLMILERLQDPCSKRSSYFNQNEYLGIEKVELQHLYRSLDKLADYNKAIQKQIYQTGRDLFNQQLDVVFYDVTTLYFESELEQEGALRQKGFSKDGKIGTTQILFCLLIDRDKQPIGYQVFKGDTFEGHTFEKAVKDLKKDYQINQVIVVADRGMLSKNNLDVTTESGYEFIVGERLKKLPGSLQDFLLDLKNYHGEWSYSDHEDQLVMVRYATIEYQGRVIIGTYSAKRAKKDAHDRAEKLQTAETLLSRPELLSKKAGRFYLKKQGSQTYQLDQEKIKRDERFDGFLAIATNNKSLSVSETLEQYKHLYKIEHTFRTFKSHLETRPMFHWTDKRIEGHICLCYLSYTLLNFTLLKLEKAGFKTTEGKLRKLLDKMQVSLVEQQDKNYFLRSAASEEETDFQQKLGLKSLPSVLNVASLNQYL